MTKAYIIWLALFPCTLYSQTFQHFLDRVNSATESERTAIVDSFMTAVPSFPLVEQNTTVHFLYRGSASNASVPGDANNWSTTAFPMSRLSTTDLWYHTRTFESHARLDYKFVVNGSTWILDPRNPNTCLGGFGPNSELRMPSYVTAPEIQYYPGIPHGTLRDTIVYSGALGNSRTIRIYTPPNYESSTDSFPVILFHDGLEYVTLAQANNVIDYLISQNRIRPVIAVFVPPVNRTAEYAGNQMTQFSSFLVNEVMPSLDARYRTRRNPASRATLGASNGGNIALWLGLNHSAAFGNVAAQSSNIISSISSGFQSSPRLDLKLYLDLGTYDIPQLVPLVRNFVPVLQSKGYSHLFYEYHEGHSWGNWRAHIDNALEMFFPPTPNAVSENGEVIKEYRLEQNYPNPFNPTTTIRFSLTPFSPLLKGEGTGVSVSLKVYDMLGREVAILVNEVNQPGTHTIQWRPDGLASGVYLYRLDAGGFSQTKRMLLIR
ncbi:MAG: T9SS type A sorting domain-containing protein [Ignavibacteriae bacterium]|nr:T9SS type A sorting domain-containing protein [Ignavibacteriota bacterium]